MYDKAFIMSMIDNVWQGLCKLSDLVKQPYIIFCEPQQCSASHQFYVSSCYDTKSVQHKYHYVTLYRDWGVCIKIENKFKDVELKLINILLYFLKLGKDLIRIISI